MPTPEELAMARDDVALRLGHLVMDAAELEREVRVVYAYLTEGDETDYRDNVLRGRHQTSDVIRRAKAEVRRRLSPDLADPLIAALEASHQPLNERGDLIHSVWLGTVFQDAPEPLRASMREMDRLRETDPEEITRIRVELRHVKEQLTEAFINIYFALESD